MTIRTLGAESASETLVLHVPFGDFYGFIAVKIVDPSYTESVTNILSDGGEMVCVIRVAQSRDLKQN